MSDETSPCLSCGACCATYRVSFYWAEADDAPGGQVPHGLTEQLTPNMRCMKGTSQSSPRCVALDGEIGQRVGCRIYPLRSSTCHALVAGDDQCQRARQRHGLPPLPASPT